VRGSRPETDERVAVQWASDEEPDSEADEIVGYSEDGQGLKVNQSTAHFLCAYTDVHVYTLIKMRTQVTHYFESGVMQSINYFVHTHTIYESQVEYISEEECAFLYDEIFVRQEYLQHGIICKLEQTGKEERQSTRLKESRQGERKGQCLEQSRIA